MVHELLKGLFSSLLSPANTEDAIYHGTIIGEIQGHYVQQQGPNSFILHAKADLQSSQLSCGLNCTIHYSQGVATTKLVLQAEHAPSRAHDR